MAKELSLFSVSLKNIRRKPLRTGMLIFSIMLLVSVLVFALSFIYRVHASIRTMSARLGADILIVPTGSRGAAEDILLENKAKSFYMDRSVLQKLKTIPGIEELTHQTYLVTLTSLCCSVPTSMVVAFDQDSDFIVKPWLTKKIGRRLQKGEAIAGNESAFNINLGLVEIDSVIFGNVFKIVGVLDKTGTGFDNALFIGEENIGDIIKTGTVNLKPGEISIAFAKVKKGYDPKKVADQIEDTVIEVDTVARKDIGKSIIRTLRDMSQIFSITVVLASILSVFLTWTVFSAVANERSREIGIMRAIGAKESHIVRIFLAEVILIGTIGSVVGILSGVMLALVLSKGFYILQTLSTDLNILERAVIGLIGFVMGVGVCVIGAYSPVQRIRKIEPLMIIKGE